MKLKRGRERGREKNKIKRKKLHDGEDKDALHFEDMVCLVVWKSTGADTVRGSKVGSSEGGRCWSLVRMTVQGVGEIPERRQRGEVP